MRRCLSIPGNTVACGIKVLHYVALPKKPLYDAQAKVYYFTPSMLSYFVHPNDLNSGPLTPSSP